MILLDASVLIRFLRRRDPRLGRALDVLDLGICGVTRAEILHGAQDEDDERKLIGLMAAFAFVEMPHGIWDKLGRRLRELRRRGIVVPFSDALLATVAIDRDLEVWAFDRHFNLMAEVLPLKLYQGLVTQ